MDLVWYGWGKRALAGLFPLEMEDSESIRPFKLTIGGWGYTERGAILNAVGLFVNRVFF